jgi:drug/metabolite transporter (DMT)-like permease
MFAAFFSFAVNGEVLSPLSCFGAVLILCGIIMGELHFTLPPPPEWAPPALRARWARAREAQLAAAADAAAAAALAADGKLGDAGRGDAQEGVELSERVSLLAAPDEA